MQRLAPRPETCVIRRFPLLTRRLCLGLCRVHLLCSAVAASSLSAVCVCPVRCCFQMIAKNMAICIGPNLYKPPAVDTAGAGAQSPQEAMKIIQQCKHYTTSGYKRKRSSKQTSNAYIARHLTLDLTVCVFQLPGAVHPHARAAARPKEEPGLNQLRTPVFLCVSLPLLLSSFPPFVFCTSVLAFSSFSFRCSRLLCFAPPLSPLSFALSVLRLAYYLHRSRALFSPDHRSFTALIHTLRRSSLSSFLARRPPSSRSLVRDGLVLSGSALLSVPAPL